MCTKLHVVRANQNSWKLSGRFFWLKLRLRPVSALSAVSVRISTRMTSFVSFWSDIYDTLQKSATELRWFLCASFADRNKTQILVNFQKKLNSEFLSFFARLWKRLPQQVFWWVVKCCILVSRLQKNIGLTVICSSG